jgi:hypothetical protein
MEGSRFDDLARSIGASRSRRQLFRTIVAGAAGSVATVIGMRRAGADGGDPLDSTPGGQADCSAFGAACAVDTECCGGFCIGGFCGCGLNTECPGADVCQDGVCVPATCQGDNWCGSGQVCCDGVCEMGECCDDLDCPGAEVCAAGGDGSSACVTVSCSADVDCGTGQFCCGGVCEIGACCSSGQLKCDDGACAECCGDDDCGANEACRSGFCGAACATDTDCTGGQSCLNGFCGCGSGFVYCDGICTECCLDTDCPGVEVCCDGACTADGCLEGVTTLPTTGTGSSR